MEKLLKTGKAKAIGVANFSKPYLEELLSQVEVVPAVNQIENHPLLPQQEIVDFCKENNIHITAFSPFGSRGGPLFKDQTIIQVSEKHNTGPGNVLLSYHGKYIGQTTSISSRLSSHIRGLDCNKIELIAGQSPS
jgi:glycerol 2-dehydrogenase (NADP+)